MSTAKIGAMKKPNEPGQGGGHSGANSGQQPPSQPMWSFSLAQFHSAVFDGHFEDLIIAILAAKAFPHLRVIETLLKTQSNKTDREETAESEVPALDQSERSVVQLRMSLREMEERSLEGDVEAFGVVLLMSTLTANSLNRLARARPELAQKYSNVMTSWPALLPNEGFLLDQVKDFLFSRLGLAKLLGLEKKFGMALGNPHRQVALLLIIYMRLLRAHNPGGNLDQVTLACLALPPFCKSTEDEWADCAKRIFLHNWDFVVAAKLVPEFGKHKKQADFCKELKRGFLALAPKFLSAPVSESAASIAT